MIDESTLLRALMDQLPDAVYFKDLQGRYVRVNRTMADWLGLQDPGEAAGKTDADFYPKEFARAILEIDQTIVRTGVPILDQEEKVVGPDGKTRWISTSKLPLRDGAGAVIGTLGISRDLRTLKRAEERTRDSEALYQSLIETLPQCIFRKDVEGRYVYVNKPMCDLFGLSPKDFLGKSDLDINPPANAAKYRRDDQWVITHQKLFTDVEDLKAKRKKIRIRIFKTPVYDSRGRVVGIQGVFSPLPEKAHKPVSAP